MRATELTQEAYCAYGGVIAAREDVRPRPANLGSAQRYDALAPLENRRPDATANLCVFRCEPQVPPGATRFDVRLLERHALSTQAFIPMSGVQRYLVIVCLGAATPDLATLKAFVATGAQGITYAPGIWHHPLVALDRRADFACLVWESGAAEDCEVVRLAAPVTVEIPREIPRNDRG